MTLQKYRQICAEAVYTLRPINLKGSFRAQSTCCYSFNVTIKRIPKMLASCRLLLVLFGHYYHVHWVFISVVTVGMHWRTNNSMFPHTSSCLLGILAFSNVVVWEFQSYHFPRSFQMVQVMIVMTVAYYSNSSAVL